MIDKDAKLTIWAAGIFDGEGSTLISKTGSEEVPYFQIVVKVSTTDTEISEPIMAKWGGHYPKNQDSKRNYGNTKSGKPYRTEYAVEFSRQEALLFLTDILPYIRTRIERVKIIIEALEATKFLDDINESNPIIGWDKDGKSFFRPSKRVKGVSGVLQPFYDRLLVYSSDLKKGYHGPKLYREYPKKLEVLMNRGRLNGMSKSTE